MDSRRIRVVLIDADNTLFDFDKSQRESLLETIEVSKKSEEADGAFSAFKEINDRAWREHEEGTLSRERLRHERFRRFREIRPFRRSDAEASDFFLETLSRKGELFSGVRETLAELKRKGLRLGLATNGFTRVQRGRIEAAGLARHFDGIFISEEMGTKKPDAAFFAACLEALDASPQSTLMAGDSPAADVAGAKGAGIACAWINRHGLPYPPELPSPDMELRSINELPRALGIAL